MIATVAPRACGSPSRIAATGSGYEMVVDIAGTVRDVDVVERRLK
jgi:hypothetical protein